MEEKPLTTPDSPKDGPEPTVVTKAKVELARIQEALLAKNQELLSCDETKLPQVARELQRLRVAMISLNELVTNISDPTAKQELGLLTKMLHGRDESGEGAAEDELEEAAAAKRLREADIDPESAENMARALRALQAVMTHGGQLTRPS